MLYAQSNSDVPFNEVVKATKSSGQVNMNPIVQVLMLLVDETDTTELEADGIRYAMLDTTCRALAFT